MPTSENNKYNYQFKNKLPEEMNACYKEESISARNEDKTSFYNYKKEIEKLTSEIDRNRFELDRTKSELERTKSEFDRKMEKIEKVSTRC